MNNDSKFKWNSEGNKIDRVCRRLLQEELLNENIVGVLDVGDNRIFFKPDIDLILVNKYYKLSTLELKAVGFSADANGDHKVFLEYISNQNKFIATNGLEGKGNVLICKADYFLFYFTKEDEYLLMETEKLKEWLLANQTKFPVKSAPTKGRNGDVLYYSWGVIVPIKILMKEIGAKLIKSHTSFKKYEAAYMSEQKNNY